MTDKEFHVKEMQDMREWHVKQMQSMWRFTWVMVFLAWVIGLVHGVGLAVTWR